MRHRSFILLLTSIIFSISLFGESNKENISEETTYLMVPAKKCREKNQAGTDYFCNNNFSSKAFSDRKIQVIDERKSLVKFISVSNSSEGDDLELLCYRCSFGKTPTEFCGRYQSNWNKPEKAKFCPSLN